MPHNKTRHQLNHEINAALNRRRGRGHLWIGTEVQSLLFARPTWTTSKAKAWAKKHGYRYGDVDVTERYVHLRQFTPVPGTEKRTQTFGKGIKAVIEQVK